jgi:hypothetical protein
MAMVMEGNGNGRGQLPVNIEVSLRDRIFAVLVASKSSRQENLKALSQCASHIRNKTLLEKTARACKLKLSGFQFGEVLEIYYDIKRGSEEMGYISRGWEDHGFRIGDLLAIPKSKAARIKACIGQIRKFCAVNGIGMTVAKKKESIRICMDGVIYSEGFNKKTFVSTFDTLHECVEKARELIG